MDWLLPPPQTNFHRISWHQYFFKKKKQEIHICSQPCESLCSPTSHWTLPFSWTITSSRKSCLTLLYILKLLLWSGLKNRAAEPLRFTLAWRCSSLLILRDWPWLKVGVIPAFYVGPLLLAPNVLLFGVIICMHRNHKLPKGRIAFDTCLFPDLGIMPCTKQVLHVQPSDFSRVFHSRYIETMNTILKCNELFCCPRLYFCTHLQCNPQINAFSPHLSCGFCHTLPLQNVPSGFGFHGNLSLGEKSVSAEGEPWKPIVSWCNKVTTGVERAGKEWAPTPVGRQCSSCWFHLGKVYRAENFLKAQLKTEAN